MRSEGKAPQAVHRISQERYGTNRLLLFIDHRATHPETSAGHGVGTRPGTGNRVRGVDAGGAPPTSAIMLVSDRGVALVSSAMSPVADGKSSGSQRSPRTLQSDWEGVVPAVRGT